MIPLLNQLSYSANRLRHLDDPARGGLAREEASVSALKSAHLCYCGRLSKRDFAANLLAGGATSKLLMLHAVEALRENARVAGENSQ